MSDEGPGIGSTSEVSEHVGSRLEELVSPASLTDQKTTGSTGSTAVAARFNVKKALAGAVATIGLISGVIGIWPVFFSDDTRISSAALSAEPFRPGDVLHYALPVDVDLSTLPSGGATCTPEQKEWLDTNGVLFQRDHLLEMRNTASSGSAMSLDDIQGQGEISTPAERRVTVQCSLSGEPGVVTEPARVDPATGQGAFFDTSGQGGGQGRGQALTPVAYNLRPGEVGQIVLTVSSSMDFTGQLLTEVAVGQESNLLPFGEANAENLYIPGVESPRSLVFDVKDGNLVCRIVPNVTDNGRTACSVEEYFSADGR